MTVLPPRQYHSRQPLHQPWAFSPAAAGDAAMTVRRSRGHHGRCAHVTSVAARAHAPKCDIAPVVRQSSSVSPRAREQGWRHAGPQRRVTCSHQNVQQPPSVLKTGSCRCQQPFCKPLPASLAHAKLPLGHSTAGHRARSAALLVGSSLPPAQRSTAPATTSSAPGTGWLPSGRKCPAHAGTTVPAVLEWDQAAPQLFAPKLPSKEYCRVMEPRRACRGGS